MKSNHVHLPAAAPSQRDDSLDAPDNLLENEDLVGEALTRLETAMDALTELAAVPELNGDEN